MTRALVCTVSHSFDDDGPLGVGRDAAPRAWPTIARMNQIAAWSSLLLILVYEVHAHAVSRRDPTRQMRFINTYMRRIWVQAMSAQAGFEIVAVQALRNALMSATVVASTAALALMVALRFFDRPTPVEIA